jgi:hypothetical protein
MLDAYAIYRVSHGIFEGCRFGMSCCGVCEEVGDAHWHHDELEVGVLLAESFDENGIGVDALARRVVEVLAAGLVLVGLHGEAASCHDDCKLDGKDKYVTITTQSN